MQDKSGWAAVIMMLAIELERFEGGLKDGL